MATSVISNTITAPDGTAIASCPVHISLQPVPGFRTSALSEVARKIITTTNASGLWSVSLERNADITPANTWYQIEELIPVEYGGPRRWNIQVGSSNQTVFAALITTPATVPVATYLTQASADARYVQSPGAFAVSTTDSRPGDAGSNGAASTYARGDHAHDRETQRGTAAVIAALSGTDLIIGYPYITSDANAITGSGVAKSDTTSQPARADSLWVKNAVRFQPGFWNQPWGIVGTADATGQSGIAAVTTDVTGATITFTAAANRRYKVTARFAWTQVTTGGTTTLRIRDSGGTTQRFVQLTGVAAALHYTPLVAILSPAAGSTTYKMSCETSAGTLTLAAGGAADCGILIEDIGPNGAAA